MNRSKAEVPEWPVLTFETVGSNQQPDTITHISSRKSVTRYLAELLAHIDFLRFLIWKELKVRYRNMALGIVWATLQPLVYVVALLFVNRFSNHSDGAEIPFPVFIFSGVIFWQLLSAVVNGSTQMLMSNSAIMQKVYFPKFLIPVASGVIALIEIIPAMTLFTVMMAASDLNIGASTLFALLVGSVITALAGIGGAGIVSLWVLRWPSLRHGVPLALHVLLFISPVLYRLDAQVQETVQGLVTLIPISGPIEYLRGSIDGNTSGGLLVTSLLISVSIAFIGFFNYVFGEDKAIENA